MQDFTKTRTAGEREKVQPESEWKLDAPSLLFGVLPADSTDVGIPLTRVISQ